MGNIHSTDWAKRIKMYRPWKYDEVIEYATGGKGDEKFRISKEVCRDHFTGQVVWMVIPATNDAVIMDTFLERKNAVAFIKFMEWEEVK